MLLLLVQAALGGTVTVTATQSLQDACAGLADGDTLLVEPGRVPTADHDTCTLGGLKGVTVKSSKAEAADVGGVFVYSSGVVTLENLKVAAHVDGYNVWIWGSNAVVLNDLHLMESAEYGVYLTDSEVEVNALQADEPLHSGDTLMTVGATPSATFADVVVNGATATGPGARIEVVGTPDLNVELHDLVLDGGAAGRATDAYGGCLHIDGNATISGGPVVLVETPQLENCDAFKGGAMSVGKGDVTLKSGALSSSAAEYGGGLYGGPESVLTLSDVTLSGNTAESGGGGIWLDSGSLSGEGLNLSSNNATLGAGLAAVESEATLTRSVICDNRVSGFSDDAGSVASVMGGVLTLDHSEVRANGGGTALFFVENSATLDLDHVSLWENDDDLLFALENSTATMKIRSSLLTHADFGIVGLPIQGGYNYWYAVGTPSTGTSLPSSDVVSSQDPGLGLWPAGSECLTPLHLEAGSPLVDAGDPTRAKDSDGSTEDIGAHAFEHGPDTGDSGGETGETGDSAETGDSGDSGDSGGVDSQQDTGVEPQAVLLSGGCGRGSSSGALLLGFGLLLLGRRRRGG